MILFVHGWGYDAGFWDPVRAALGNVASAALDLGYFGAADTAVPPDVTLLDATAHVAESLRDSPRVWPETRPRGVSLRELWQAAPLVLLFMRHFG